VNLVPLRLTEAGWQLKAVLIVGYACAGNWAEPNSILSLQLMLAGFPRPACRAQGDMATILLVDKDPLQAIQRKSILERRFNDVQRVRDAAEALCLVEQPQFAGNLGLVISGEHMQGIGIGGPAFVAELHARLPKLPVLVLGVSSEAAGDYPGGWVRFLAKPHASEEMLKMAAILLGQHEAKSA
jgi:DNA-binding NtrC family response regulator